MLTGWSWERLLAVTWSKRELFLCTGRVAGYSIAGVIVHIPAGIGVLEAVLSHYWQGRIHPKAQLSPPCSLSRPVLLYPAAAGADLLPATESQAKKLRAKNEAAM